MHAPIAMAAIRLGKHIYVEKPMAHDLFEVRALADIGCHVFDASDWAGGTTAPLAVEAEQAASTDYCGPAWSIIRYEFPATATRPPIKLTWYDGGKLPPRPPEMEPDREIKKGSNGTLIVGDKGTIVLPHAAASGPRLIPEAKMKEFKRPQPTIPRIGGQRNGHHKNFVEACLTGKPAGSNFDYAGPLTEIVLLGNVAIRAGKRIEWDSANMKITNAPELNHLLRREYRRGWEL